MLHEPEGIPIDLGGGGSRHVTEKSVLTPSLSVTRIAFHDSEQSLLREGEPSGRPMSGRRSGRDGACRDTGARCLCDIGRESPRWAVGHVNRRREGGLLYPSA